MERARASDLKSRKQPAWARYAARASASSPVQAVFGVSNIAPAFALLATAAGDDRSAKAPALQASSPQTVNGNLTVNRSQGVVFGRKMIIILSQLQPLLILTMV
jgi:hypothetical protein